MRARVLEPQEWQRINSPGMPALLAYTEPQNVDVVVVENSSDEIVASVCAMQVTHFEGLWIKPEERGNAGVFRALIREAYSLPKSREERWVFGGAEDGNDQMDALCERLGGKALPVKFYVMPVGV